MVCFTMCLDFPAGGEQRFLEVAPDMLDRMAMVGLQAGLRIDRCDGFSEAVRVIRKSCGHLEAAVFESLQKLPGIVPILRGRFMGHQDAIMFILDHHFTTGHFPSTETYRLTR